MGWQKNCLPQNRSLVLKKRLRTTGLSHSVCGVTLHNPSKEIQHPSLHVPFTWSCPQVTSPAALASSLIKRETAAECSRTPNQVRNRGPSTEEPHFRCPSLPTRGWCSAGCRVTKHERGITTSQGGPKGQTRASAWNAVRRQISNST